MGRCCVVMLGEVREPSCKAMWMKLGVATVLRICLLAAVLVADGSTTTEDLAGMPIIGTTTKLFSASVYTPAPTPPTQTPTPAPSINIGGEPVIMAGSYITESTNQTISMLQLKARKEMAMVQAITRDIHRNKQHVSGMQAGSGPNAGC